MPTSGLGARTAALSLGVHVFARRAALGATTLDEAAGTADAQDAAGAADAQDTARAADAQEAARTANAENTADAAKTQHARCAKQAEDAQEAEIAPEGESRPATLYEVGPAHRLLRFLKRVLPFVRPNGLHHLSRSLPGVGDFRDSWP